MTSYKESIDYLFGLQKFGIKFGLNCTERLLERLGDPHRALRCIHVGGTNGKGSTSAMLARMLQEHGFRVGLYTSPHLVRFTERFKINDVEVSPERIMEVFARVRRVIDEAHPPTFFEVVTALGLLYFAEEKVDWAVVEVGMGGRLDATNVIRPEVSVITNVAYDHQEYLGTSLAAIAREKAGIIKEGVPLVTAAQQPLVQATLKATCMRLKAPLYRLGSDFRTRRHASGLFQYQGLRHEWPELELGLSGVHQVSNAAVALAVMELLEKGGALTLDSGAVQQGLLGVHWPARLEVLGRDPLILLDGAHNPQGAESLRETLKRCFTYKNLYLVVGIMADKDIRGIFRRLLPLAHTAIFTQPRYARAATAEELQRLAAPYVKHHSVIPDPSAAIAEARRLAGPEDLICITGSLYFAGEVKELFGEPSI